MGKKVTPEYNFAVLHPDTAQEWHPTKNCDLRPPERMAPQSNKMAWWKCKQGHEWPARINTRARGIGCPYCSGKLATPERNLKTLFPAVADEWHPTKNGDLCPEHMTPHSNKMAWWKCKKGHEWSRNIHNRVKALVEKVT